MIKNYNEVITYIGKWIADYAVKNGKDNLYLNFRGCPNDALALHCCAESTKYSKVWVNAICSDASSYQLLEYFFFGRRSFMSLQFDKEMYDDLFFLIVANEASKNNGIVVGSLDHTNGKVLRHYNKRGDGSCDIQPLLNMSHSDVVDLTHRLWPNIDWILQSPDSKVDELAIETAIKHNMLYAEEPPNKNKFWPYLTLTLKEKISFIHQREKITRHKDIKVPHPDLSSYVKA